VVVDTRLDVEPLVAEDPVVGLRIEEEKLSLGAEPLVTRLMLP